MKQKSLFSILTGAVFLHKGAVMLHKLDVFCGKQIIVFVFVSVSLYVHGEGDKNKSLKFASFLPCCLSSEKKFGSLTMICHQREILIYFHDETNNVDIEY